MRLPKIVIHEKYNKSGKFTRNTRFFIVISYALYEILHLNAISIIKNILNFGRHFALVISTGEETILH